MAEPLSPDELRTRILKKREERLRFMTLAKVKVGSNGWLTRVTGTKIVSVTPELRSRKCEKFSFLTSQTWN